MISNIAAKLTAVSAGALLVGLWIFFHAFGRLKLRRAVAGTPTSKARSAAMGKCELKGLAREVDLPILGPFSGAPCVWYRWRVEEERSDSKGNRSWHLVDEKFSLEPFYLEDSTGRIKIDPEGAEVEAPELLRYTDGVFSMVSRPQGPQAAGWLNFGHRRLTEWRIDQARPVYALGVLRLLKSAPDAEPEHVLAQGRADEPFFISTKSENEVLSELEWSVLGRLLLGATLGIAGAIGLVRVLFKF